MRSDLSIKTLFNYFANVFYNNATSFISSNRYCFRYYYSIIICSLYFYYNFFFDNDLSFENDLYIIKYVIIVIMIMSKISLRGSVENNNSYFYFANDLIEVVFILVFRIYYNFLVKLI